MKMKKMMKPKDKNMIKKKLSLRTTTAENQVY